MKNFRVLQYSAMVLALDQLSKVLARIFLRERGSIQVVGNLLRLTYVENPGIAFGIEVGGKAMFTVLIGLVSLGILFYLYRIRGEHSAARFALALIFGGALGNLFDRIAFGRVVDFIDVDFPDFIMKRWPVFNVADAAVSIGMVILIALVLSDRAPENESAPEKKEEKSGCAD